MKDNGIGLAICNRMVENYVGTNTAYREEGVGVTSEIYRPLSSEK